jgi:hypothetical protein
MATGTVKWHSIGWAYKGICAGAERLVAECPTNRIRLLTSAILIEIGLHSWNHGFMEVF